MAKVTCEDGTVLQAFERPIYCDKEKRITSQLVVYIRKMTMKDGTIAHHYQHICKSCELDKDGIVLDVHHELASANDFQHLARNDYY